MAEISLTQLKTKKISILTHLRQTQSTIVETEDTTPEGKLEIKHENDHYKTEYKAEFNCTSSEKVIIAPTWGKHMHSYLGNAKQAYSIE